MHRFGRGRRIGDEPNQQINTLDRYIRQKEDATAFDREFAEALRISAQEADQAAILQESLRETEEAHMLKELISNPEVLRSILGTLMGVDPMNPIFDQFYN